ncbi:MAG: hypothetical protein D6785_00495 [Planctomycetota bacterium]|nr:MAG: hypothetical protein D6785_00495 [Planctomycetota bacterium]
MDWSWIIYFLCIWGGIEVGYYFGRKKERELLESKDSNQTLEVGEKKTEMPEKNTVTIVDEATGELRTLPKEEVKEQYKTTIQEIKLLRYGLLQYAFHSPQKEIRLHPKDQLPPPLQKLVELAIDKPYMWNQQKLAYIWPDLLLYFAQASSLPKLPWKGEFNCQMDNLSCTFEILVEENNYLVIRCK